MIVMFGIPFLFALVGLLFSAYATMVYYRSKKSKNYHAFCDLDDRISCTKTFASDYGLHFGIPNGIWGIGFYSLFITLLQVGAAYVILALSTMALVGSLWLAYVLFFRLRLFCLVCVLLYAVNVILFVFSLSALLSSPGVTWIGA